MILKVVSCIRRNLLKLKNSIKTFNRYSLRVKLTFSLTALIIIMIFSIWYFNRSQLVNYYLHTKIDTLDKAYNEIDTILKDKKKYSDLTSEDIKKIEQFRENKNVSIYIITDRLESMYPYYDRPFSEFEYILNLLKDYIYGTNPKVNLKSTDNYDIFKIYDTRVESNYIDLLNVRDNHYIVYMRTNFESMQESVAVANQFLAYIGIVFLLVGTTIMFFISKRFTQPILKLAGIAKRMSDLDFNVKYEVKTQDEIGELGGSINTLADKLEETISELKSANNELRSDIQNKIQIDEMRKDFLSNVTHELKTPIALIQGYAEGLIDNVNEDADSREFYCEVIMDEAKKMNEMVKKLLSLNQIEFGNNQVNISRFDIVALVQSVLNSIEILVKQKDVLLHFEHQEPIYVWADEYMVEEAFTNYMSNALNHVDGDRIIEVKLIQKEKVIRVAVFNTGDNIPEDDLDHIWIKFYKVDKARTREYGGSGIGLSIVKAIMTSMNQQCGVINHSKGVEFWFELDTNTEET